MTVCYLPMPGETAGNGAHVHLSLWKDGVNISGDSEDEHKTSKVFKDFIAGILHHYPALIHILAPSHNGTRRLKPGYFSGTYCIWGIDNKEAAIRISHPAEPLNIATNVEVKTLDHSANVFHALAATLACGIAGLT